MAYLLQVDFKHVGPYGDEMADVYSDLAESINEEPGFLWKIWTENQQTNEAGGIYIFEKKEDAEKYVDKHTKRLSGFGITNANMKIFVINERLSQITQSPLK